MCGCSAARQADAGPSLVPTHAAAAGSQIQPCANCSSALVGWHFSNLMSIWTGLLGWQVTGGHHTMDCLQGCQNAALNRLRGGRRGHALTPLYGGAGCPFGTRGPAARMSAWNLLARSVAALISCQSRCPPSPCRFCMSTLCSMRLVDASQQGGKCSAPT